MNQARLFRLIQIWIIYFLKAIRCRLIFVMPGWMASKFKTDAELRFDLTWDSMSDAERKRLLGTKGEGFLWLLAHYERKYQNNDDENK